MKKIFLSMMTFLFILRGESAEFHTIVQTKNRENIEVNGANADFCSLEIHKRKNQQEVYLFVNDVKNRGGRVFLFEIDENGQQLKYKWFIANQVSPEDTQEGYKFIYNKKGILFDNGENLIGRDFFHIQFDKMDSSRIVEVEYRNGNSRLGRGLLALPSVIFGADNHGNDIKCKFD